MARVSGSDLARVAARTPLLQATWNYERQQGLGWAWCFAPVLERLYPDAATRRNWAPFCLPCATAWLGST